MIWPKSYYDAFLPFSLFGGCWAFEAALLEGKIKPTDEFEHPEFGVMTYGNCSSPRFTEACRLALLGETFDLARAEAWAAELREGA